MPRKTTNLISLALFGLLAAAGGAHGHSWYPKKCCSEQDCFRVVKIEQLPDGRRMTLDNESHTQVFVSVDQLFDRSEDSDYHLCIVADLFSSGILCAFEPSLTALPSPPRHVSLHPATRTP